MGRTYARYDGVTWWMPARNSALWVLMREAGADDGYEWSPGVYELIGPKVNNNPESVNQHFFRPCETNAFKYALKVIPRAVWERVNAIENEKKRPEAVLTNWKVTVTAKEITLTPAELGKAQVTGNIFETSADYSTEINRNTGVIRILRTS